jgi:hypothetical protein
MKKYNTRFGKIVQWVDYIKSKKNKNTQETFFEQSNTKLENYSQRYIGVYLSHNNDIYVAVAVDKKGEGGTWWKYIIENRIQTLMNNANNMSVDDRGVTVIPYRYLEYLYTDPYVYSNLYGKIDPTTLGIALRMLKEDLNKEINHAYNSMNRD